MIYRFNDGEADAQQQQDILESFLKVKWPVYIRTRKGIKRLVRKENNPSQWALGLGLLPLNITQRTARPAWIPSTTIQKKKARLLLLSDLSDKRNV